MCEFQRDMTAQPPANGLTPDDGQFGSNQPYPPYGGAPYGGPPYGGAPNGGAPYGPPKPFYPQGSYYPPPPPQQQQQQSTVVVAEVNQPRYVVVRSQGFAGHIALACVVFWFCGGLFGLIAFILARKRKKTCY